MMCESMLSTNAGIAPMHCCLGEPDCLAGIMLLFQTDWVHNMRAQTDWGTKQGAPYFTAKNNHLQFDWLIFDNSKQFFDCLSVF